MCKQEIRHTVTWSWSITWCYWLTGRFLVLYQAPGYPAWHDRFAGFAFELENSTLGGREWEKKPRFRGHFTTQHDNVNKTNIKTSYENCAALIYAQRLHLSSVPCYGLPWPRQELSLHPRKIAICRHSRCLFPCFDNEVQWWQQVSQWTSLMPSLAGPVVTGMRR